jgi:hypothetical protein
MLLLRWIKSANVTTAGTLATKLLVLIACYVYVVMCCTRCNRTCWLLVDRYQHEWVALNVQGTM